MSDFGDVRDLRDFGRPERARTATTDVLERARGIVVAAMNKTQSRAIMTVIDAELKRREAVRP